MFLVFSAGLTLVATREIVGVEVWPDRLVVRRILDKRTYLFNDVRSIGTDTLGGYRQQPVASVRIDLKEGKPVQLSGFPDASYKLYEDLLETFQKCPAA
jgi:hypothetical protein